MKLNKGFRSLLIFFLFLGLTQVITACSKDSNSDVNDSNWKNEVLMMDECGSDGLKCCVDQDPACSFGQDCCVDPNNPENNFCADECSFGNLNEFCLEGNICNDNLVCMKGVCQPCGIAGNTCCEGENKCLHENSLEDDRTECLNNICSLCGHSSKKVCEGDDICNYGYFENNDKCLSCGVFNTPCCQNDDGSYCLSDDLKCELGFCVK